MWTLAFGPARRSDAEARLHRHSGGCYGGIRQELAARIGHKSVCCHNDCLERICAIPNRWKIDDCVQISHLYRARVLLCCRISLGRFVVERSILGWQRSLEAAKLFRSTANISAILAFALRFGLALSSRLAVYRINTSPSSETRMTAYGKKCECRLSHELRTSRSMQRGPTVGRRNCYGRVRFVPALGRLRLFGAASRHSGSKIISMKP